MLVITSTPTACENFSKRSDLKSSNATKYSKKDNSLPDEKHKSVLYSKDENTHFCIYAKHRKILPFPEK